jgi:hypothetical protein
MSEESSIPGKVAAAPCGCSCRACRAGDCAACRDPLACATRRGALAETPADAAVGALPRVEVLA